MAGNNQKGGILLDKKQPIPQQNGGINSGQFDQEAFMEYYYELNDDDKLKEQIVKNFDIMTHIMRLKIVEDIEKLKQMHRDIPSRTNTIGLKPEQLIEELDYDTIANNKEQLDDLIVDLNFSTD